jgi:hypothetical protein
LPFRGNENRNATEGTRRQWLTPAQQVRHLKSKGVKFDLMSEAEAEQCLRENNIPNMLIL